MPEEVVDFVGPNSERLLVSIERCQGLVPGAACCAPTGEDAESADLSGSDDGQAGDSQAEKQQKNTEADQA